MTLPRASGILLHPTSLPGPYGIGDLGTPAYRFVDWLVTAEQSIWQVLPLGPTGYGDSPYQCFSSFAGNPMLLSPELLADQGLLTQGDLAEATFPSAYVDYGALIPWKTELLHRAYERWSAQSHDAAFDQFCAAQADWLDDYALFMAL